MSTWLERFSRQRRRLDREAELREKFGDDYGKPASQRTLDPYPSKPKAKPKYAKDRFGVSDAFSGKNRRQRRAEAAAYRRNFYRFAETGHRLELARMGDRSRKRRSLREGAKPNTRFANGR